MGLWLVEGSKLLEIEGGELGTWRIYGRKIMWEYEDSGRDSVFGVPVSMPLKIIGVERSPLFRRMSETLKPQLGTCWDVLGASCAYQGL